MKFNTLNISDKDVKKANHLDGMINNVLHKATYTIKKNIH